MTTRAAVLLGVLAVLAASYALPVRAWLDQGGRLDDAVAERDALAAEVDALEGLRDLWDDPAYVRAQARERLNYVLPGEVGLVVLGTESTPPEQLATGAVVPALAPDQPWWSTVVAAFQEVGAGTMVTEDETSPEASPVPDAATDPVPADAS